MEGKKYPTTVDFVAALLKEHHTLASNCLATTSLFSIARFKESRIQYQLLICWSPHSNAFVHSRAADVHGSPLCFGVGTPIFSHVYICFRFKPLWSWPPGQLRPFSSFGFIAYIIRNTWRKVKWYSSVLMFRNLKSFCARIVFIQ